MLDNNQIHYTALALEQGYSIDVGTGEFFDPNGDVVANDPAVWEQVVIPNVLDDYVAEKRAQLETSGLLSQMALTSITTQRTCPTLGAV